MTKRRALKTGIIHYPVSAAEVVAQAWEDLGLNGDEHELAALDEYEEDEELMTKLPFCYIKEGEKVFRVKDIETPDIQKCPEGALVSFETPVVQRGIDAWAYRIKPIK